MLLFWQVSSRKNYQWVWDVMGRAKSNREHTGMEDGEALDQETQRGKEDRQQLSRGHGPAVAGIFPCLSFQALPKPGEVLLSEGSSPFCPNMSWSLLVSPIWPAP